MLRFLLVNKTLWHSSTSKHALVRSYRSITNLSRSLKSLSFRWEFDDKLKRDKELLKAYSQKVISQRLFYNDKGSPLLGSVPDPFACLRRSRINNENRNNARRHNRKTKKISKVLSIFCPGIQGFFRTVILFESTSVTAKCIEIIIIKICYLC